MDLWAEPQVNVAAQRGPAGPLETPLYESQHHAVHVLREFERKIHEQGWSERYEALILELRRFVYVPRGNWEGVGAAFDPNHKTTLETLGELFAHIPGATFSLTDTQIDAMRDALQKCLDIIKRERSRGEKPLDHLAHIITSCLELLDGDDRALLELRSLSFEATALILQSSPMIRRTSLREWLKLIDPICGPFVYDFTVATASGLFISAISPMLQIEAPK